MNISSRIKKLIFVAILLAGIGLMILSRTKQSDMPLTNAFVERGDVERTVSVSGRVKSAEKIDMSFDRGGRITTVAVKVGQRVNPGQLLVKLDTNDLSAQLLQARAGVAVAQVRLEQLTNTARSEDLSAATAALKTAEANLTAEQAASVGALQTAFNVAADAMITATEIQFRYFNNTYSDSIDLADKKAAALQAMYGEANLGNVGAWYFIPLTSGLRERVLALNNNSSVETIQVVSNNLSTALSLVRLVLEKETSSLSSINATTEVDKTAVSNARSAILSQVSALTSRQQALNNAVNTRAQAVATAASRQQPGSKYDIESARAQLLQAQAGVSLISAQIEQRILRATLSGTVVSLDATAGEQATVAKTVVSILGSAPFYIETNVAESDIATVNAGDFARITVDAFGTDRVFEATVISVDPAETIVEGVTTYRTRLAFTKNYPEIRSGMTADVTIAADKRQDVLFVPSRLVIPRNGKKFIKVIKGENIEEVEITTGLRGTDGRMEITNGLTQGAQLAPR